MAGKSFEPQLNNIFNPFAGIERALQGKEEGITDLKIQLYPTAGIMSKTLGLNILSKKISYF